MPDRITVIIPVYNGARFIRDALSSVCTQTHLPAEVVVVDDVSTDQTREVVTEFARTAPVPVTLFSMQKNTGGPYGPAREAFRRTTGDYLTVLDADDMFAPDAFATFLAMYAADPGANVGLVASDLVTFADGTGEVVRPSSFARYPDLLGRVLADGSPTGVTLSREEALRAVGLAFAIPFRGLIAREAWEALGGPDPRYHHAGDCDFTWRLVNLTDFRVRLVNRPLNRVRVTQTSMSSNRIVESQQLAAVYRDMLRDTRDPELRAHLRRQLREELFNIIYLSYKRMKILDFLPAAWGLAVERLRSAVPAAF